MVHMRRAALHLTVILALLSFSEKLSASDAVSALSPKMQSIWEQEYATGDWSGLRTRLSDRGVGYRFNQIPEGELSATRTSADNQPRGRRGTTIPERGFAGSYEVGFLYHTDDFADIYDVTLSDLGSSLAPTASRNRGANYAIYVNIEQEVWREPGSEMEGLGVLGHAAWMPPNRNFLEFSIEGGLHYLGPIPGREKDALGLGLAYISISEQVAAAIRNANQSNRTSLSRTDFEATLELVYRYQAAPWVSIQPHAQYVIQPGGTNDTPNALILGVRTNIAF